MNILQQVNSFEIHRSVYINIIRNICEIETNKNLSLSLSKFRREIASSTSRFDLSGVVIDVTRVSILVSLVVRPFICSSNRAARSFLPSESICTREMETRWRDGELKWCPIAKGFAIRAHVQHGHRMCFSGFYA